jgi:hypothetical protein
MAVAAAAAAEAAAEATILYTAQILVRVRFYFMI